MSNNSNNNSIAIAITLIFCFLCIIHSFRKLQCTSFSFPNNYEIDVIVTPIFPNGESETQRG